MKKIFLIIALIFLATNAFAQVEQDTIISQQQLDSVNFDTFNLQYQVRQVYLEFDRGVWFLKANVVFLNVYRVFSNQYEVQYRVFTYSYSGQDFFNCWRTGANSDVGCFTTFVLPTWVNQFFANDFLHRKYLKSLQTGGDPMLSSELANYFI